ncbi:MAG: hypothetical protein Q9218_007069 [Villophora microphyllina]
MSKYLRGLVARRFSLIRVLWQKTLISSSLVKQVFSQQSLPQLANFTLVSINDDPSQVSILPLFHTQQSGSPDLAIRSADDSILPSRDSITSNVPAADPQTHQPAILGVVTADFDNGEARKQSSPDSSMLSDPPTSIDTPPLYANAVTQTEPSTPQTSPRSDLSDGQPDNEASKDGGEQPETPLRNDNQAAEWYAASIDPSESPEVFDGQSRMVATKINGKTYFAVLVTKEMINDLEEISAERSKLEFLEGKFEDADRAVGFGTTNIDYCKSLLNDAQTQEETDELRKDIEERQRAVEESKTHRNRLEVRVGAAKHNIPYMEALSRANFQNVLVDAGLLKLEHAYVDEEDDDQEDGAEGQAEEGEFELYPYEVESAVSEVSIEELNRRTASEEVKQRSEELLEAEQAFEARNEQYAEERTLLQERIIGGDNSMTPTEFDLIYFEHTQDLTRNLASAEDAYDEALARRKKLGPAEWDQESGFITDEYDGYPLSWEDDGIRSAPLSRIRKWLGDTPEVDNIQDIMDLDQGAGHEFGQEVQEYMETCSIQSAQMSDAWSCYDSTRNRRRIDRWRSITGRER